MSVLLLGATGQVGHALAELLVGSDARITTRTGAPNVDLPCDALDASVPGRVSALIDARRPTLVINATAYTAVDRAESEPELAFRVNAGAVGEMAEACARIGARLLHFSTDYVFDGTGDRPYRETDAPSPSSVYGRSKLAGEAAIAACGGDAVILRTSWVFAHRGHNFLRTMLRLAGERDRLRVVADQRGAPTGASMLARAALRLSAAAGATGVIHATGQGETTWHGFAEAIFQRALELGLIDRAPVVEAIGTAAYPTPAARPAYSVLDCSHAQSLGAGLEDWRECLAEELGSLETLR